MAAWANEDTVALAAHRTTAGGMERRATSAFAAGTFLVVYVLGPVAGALAYGAIVLQGRPSLRPIDKLGSPES
jgi:hypothetical protein